MARTAVPQFDLYGYDAEKRQQFPLLCGVDEAGRGPLAGDVYAAAVILSPEHLPEGLNDSKKLSEKKRELLFPQIQEQAIAYCIATASVAEIEAYNILGATMLAMQRAVAGLSVQPNHVLIGRKPDAGAFCFRRNRGERRCPFCNDCSRFHSGKGGERSLFVGTRPAISAVWLCPAQRLWDKSTLCGNFAVRSFSRTPEGIPEKAVARP